jgi:hypothetical protein
VADATLHDPPAFYHAFLSALGRYNYPRFPTPLWHICLSTACEAEAASFREEAHRRVNDEYDQWLWTKRRRERLPSGVLQIKRGRLPLDYEDYLSCRSVSTGCDRFFKNRGMPLEDFHGRQRVGDRRQNRAKGSFGSIIAQKKRCRAVTSHVFRREINDLSPVIRGHWVKA